MLKSAGALLGASLFARGLPSTSASPQYGENFSPTPMGKNMVGFMLAHEQFTVPQLVEIGAAAEQAGFDVLATSITSSPGKPMKDTRVQLGSI